MGKVAESPSADQTNGILLIEYLEKRLAMNREFYLARAVRLKENVIENHSKWRTQCTVSSDNGCNNQWQAKLHELMFESLTHPLQSRYSHRDYYTCANSKKMPQGKRFGLNDEGITKAKPYIDKLFDKVGICKAYVTLLVQPSHLMIDVLVNKESCRLHASFWNSLFTFSNVSLFYLESLLRTDRQFNLKWACTVTYCVGSDDLVRNFNLFTESKQMQSIQSYFYFRQGVRRNRVKS